MLGATPFLRCKVYDNRTILISQTSEDKARMLTELTGEIASVYGTTTDTLSEQVAKLTDKWLCPQCYTPGGSILAESTATNCQQCITYRQDHAWIPLPILCCLKAASDRMDMPILCPNLSPHALELADRETYDKQYVAPMRADGFTGPIKMSQVVKCIGSTILIF